MRDCGIRAMFFMISLSAFTIGIVNDFRLCNTAPEVWQAPGEKGMLSA